jgi:hypothetical protein
LPEGDVSGFIERTICDVSPLRVPDVKTLGLHDWKTSGEVVDGDDLGWTRPSYNHHPIARLKIWSLDLSQIDNGKISVILPVILGSIRWAVDDW